MQHTATTHLPPANTVSIVSTTYGQTLVVLNGKCLLCVPPERGDEARQLASTTAGALNVPVDVVDLDTFASDTTESQLMARLKTRMPGRGIAMRLPSRSVLNTRRNIAMTFHQLSYTVH